MQTAHNKPLTTIAGQDSFLDIGWYNGNKKMDNFESILFIFDYLKMNLHHKLFKTCEKDESLMNNDYI